MAKTPRAVDDVEPVETPEPAAPARLAMARLSRLEATRDRDFDRQFWAATTPAQRFQAAWQLVADYLALRGEDDEPRLRRSLAELRPLRR